MLTVRFKTRAFGEIGQPGPRFRVQRLTWAALGGCRSAELAAEGTVADPEQLAGLLRCPVEVYSEAGRLVWWGYVHAVQTQTAGLETRRSLDDLANRVRVAYGVLRLESVGGVQANLSGWADDPTSQALYGVKEQILSLPAGTPAQAEAWRDGLLARGRFPAVRAQAVSLAPRAGGGERVTLDCRGWWETLGWRYYSQGAALVEWREPAQARALAPLAQSSYEGLAQSFTIGGPAWYASEIWISARVSVAHTDTITVALCADAAGAPGTVLSSATLTGASFPAVNPKWVRFALGAGVLLAVGATYWVKITAGGDIMDTHYYRVLVDGTGGFGGGVGRRYDGAAWVNDGWNLQFIVAGAIETTEQIRLMAAAGGQFLTGTRIDVASGVWTNPYKVGDQSARVEIEELLNAGTAGGVRLLGEVTSNRVLVVKAQPEQAAPKFWLGRDGTLRLPGGMAAPPGADVAGEWAELREARFGPTQVWLETAVWDSSGGLRAGEL